MTNITDGPQEDDRSPAPEADLAALRGYFDELARIDREGTALLSPDEVMAQTALFAYHPAIRQLGGHVLDDADTSNHHVLLAAPPLAGSVLFLSHDGDTRVVFDAVSAFMEAVRTARERDIDVPDLHPAVSPPASDQQGLGTFIRSLLESGDATELVVALVPSLDLRDTGLLVQLAEDEDFYLGEAVALEIAKRPSAGLLPVAERCAAHPHPQVAQAGEQAVRRIRALMR